MSGTEEKKPGIDFASLKMPARKECSQCGETFRGTEDEETCPQCEFRAAHPHEQDKYWT